MKKSALRGVICVILTLTAAGYLASCSDPDFEADYAAEYSTTEATTTTATEPPAEYQELDSPDVGNVMWGMSMQEVQAQERDLDFTSRGSEMRADTTFGPYAAEVVYSFKNGGLKEVQYVIEGNSKNELYDKLSEYGKPMFGDLETGSGFSELSNGTENGIFLWRLSTSTIFVNITGNSSKGTARVSFRPDTNQGARSYRLAMLLASSEEAPSETVAVTTKADKTKDFSLQHGKLLDVNITGDTLIIKAKITPSYSNHATISQNFFNLEDLIVNQGCSKYDEIQYWAVADMTDGTESKVIAFTAPKSTIDGIKDGSIEVIAYLDEYGYLDDVYILSSLKD